MKRLSRRRIPEMRDVRDGGYLVRAGSTARCLHCGLVASIEWWSRNSTTV